MKLKDKIKGKIDRLLKSGFNVEFLEASEYEKEPIMIDKIKICKHSVFSDEKNVFDDWEWQTRWERFIVVDFERNPILSGDDAEEAYQEYLENNNKQRFSRRRVGGSFYPLTPEESFKNK